MNRIWSYLRPLLPGPDDYRGIRRSWRGDLIAGVTVGVVALPLALGFGISSGAGAESGLVTAIVAGVVAAVLGGSNVQVSGPTGAMVVILAPIVVAHGPAAVVIVSIMAGVIVVIAGVLKLGRLVALVPWPVIEGFTLGIAVIIFLQQIPSTVGAAPHASTNAMVAAVESVRRADWPAVLAPVLVAIAVGLVMWLSDRIHTRIPGSLVAILLVTLVVGVLGIPVQSIGALPSTLAAPAIPNAPWETILSLIGPASAVAALAAIESLLSARVASRMADTGRFDPDRELIGQGAASILSGLFGGMPATGAIARTAVNVRSGGRSRLAAVVHALVLLGAVYLAAPLISRIPLAALAGVLLYTAVRMVSVATVRSVLRSGWSAALAFCVTAVVTVSFDLIVAVGIGVAVTAFFALRALSSSAGVHREELPDPRPGDERIELLRLDGSLIFVGAERVLDQVRETRAEVVILRMSQLEGLDATGAHVLADLIRELERRSVTMLLKGVQAQHSTVVSRSGMLSSLRHRNHLFTDLDAAVEHARLHVARSHADPA